jgi:FtsP/CotA-like multicopper oxidase with cupredoxin domain
LVGTETIRLSHGQFRFIVEALHCALITQWADASIRASFDPDLSMMINGRSWPHTERLGYAEGDTVRWRVVNATGIHHPMHLHGFHFRVDARGDQFGETIYPPAERRLVVTETLDVGETMRLTWVPEEPGNWIFHCHFMRHMSWTQAAPYEGSDSAHAAPPDGDATSLLGGLVLGIAVQPRAGQPAPAEFPRKQLRLYMGMRARVFGEAPASGFVLQEDDRPPAIDSVRIPGSPIVLTRGEPTEIVVHNRVDHPLGVHWHGLELESRFDGVPDWSGSAGQLTPPIPPGDSLIVRMTPPRSGTFMYHVHSEPGHELAQESAAHCRDSRNGPWRSHRPGCRTPSSPGNPARPTRVIHSPWVSDSDARARNVSRSCWTTWYRAV